MKPIRLAPGIGHKEESELLIWEKLHWAGILNRTGHAFFLPLPISFLGACR